MRRRTLTILASCILAAGLVGYLVPALLIDSVTYPVSFEVRPYIGANLDPNGLHFGAGPVGTTFRRGITIHAITTEQYWIRISDNFKGMLAPEDGWSGRLGENETRTIMFTLTIPPDTLEGQHNGTVTLWFMKVPG